MKKIASFLIVASLASGAVAAQTPAPAQSNRTAGAPAFAARKLTRADFDALRANPSGLLVLDVRRPDELTSIGGFPAYLSIQAAELEKSLAWIPKDRVIVTVSNHAARAGRAADLLTKNGFNVAGAIGAQDYEAEGGTLVKIAPPAPRPASN
ncbi:MAG TPA: hypothetical protein VN759_06710 [Pseudolysinimonas sp.]|jgi:rhodanese-related sulfurtransferase|nr:hypothetical protein [Pseudolysinimonas sp.]